MFEGLDEIRAAADALVSGDQPLKARLRKAGKGFWSAMYYADLWPPSLRVIAEGIQKRILAHGSIDRTVCRMTLEEAERAAEEIVGFLVEAERRGDESSTRSAPSGCRDSNGISVVP